ncbi:MAG TPA: ATP-binding protein [Tepidisphaeraceae bacterium]|nr:ATP-binding protein [Tepidisphaeraceae bacterium]
MNSQNQNTADYLAPDISEIARRNGGQINDPLNASASDHKPTLSRSAARRLLLTCVAVPAVLWWALILGAHRRWYDIETCFVLFVFSVAAIFGLIVCLSLKRLGKMDAERAVAAEQLKRAKDAAEAANRFKSAFFANISHEIRTPLTAINGFAELLLTPKRTNQERLADARVIRRNGEHLLTLINDILDLSKIEAGKMSVDPIICNPAAIVCDVCSILRPRATEKGLKLEVQFKGNIPSTISTDPTRLRQILINLVSNAVKFTKTGSVRVEVAMKTSMAIPQPVLQFNLIDSGIGIPQERIDALFQPFVQGDASITRQYGGSGLGLAISRHFARALGGDITVTSQAGKGSTFIVTIETGSLDGVAIQENPQNAMESQDNFAGQSVRIAGSVLVAEDGIDNQALITARLRNTGLKVELAPNGKIACEKALAALNQDQPFDVILMDVQMPEMDGYSATLHLRGKGYRGPIIALTANAMERDRDKCLQAGCNDFVTKPIQLDKLFKALGRYIKVEQVTAESPTESNSTSQENLVEDFYEKLADELSQMEEAIERQDRARLVEIVQLVLGRAAAAGLKDLSADTVRLMQTAEGESSWTVLAHAVKEFGKTAHQQIG